MRHPQSAAAVEDLDAGTCHQIVGAPDLFDVVFIPNAVTVYRGVFRCDSERLKRFNRALRANGVLTPDSKYCISLALTEDDLSRTIGAIAEAARELAAHIRS